MVNILNGILFVFGLGLIPYAIPAVTPTWRWLLGVTLVIGGPLCAAWVQHWIVTSGPDYKGSVGKGLGLAFFAVVSVAFIVGVCVRAVTILLAARGLPLRHVFTIGVVGFTIVPTVFIVPPAWQAWKMRAPSDACANASFDIALAKAELRIPAAPIFSVYTNKSVSLDAYYFWFNPKMRNFCSLTANGRKAVKATNIAIGFEHAGLRDKCKNTTPNWTRTYCPAFAPKKRTGIDETDFPLHAFLFSPDDVIMGEFGGSRSSYDDSLAVRSEPQAHRFFVSSEITSDQKPLTFDCNENGRGYWCKTSYPWRDGAYLTFAFRTARDEVLTRGIRVNLETQKFFDGLRVRR